MRKINQVENKDKRGGRSQEPEVVSMESYGELDSDMKVELIQALTQRCQWHKRENIVGYLPKSEQESWRRRTRRARERPTYAGAKASPLALHEELEQENLSAVRSLDEGSEKTLTLHRPDPSSTVVFRKFCRVRRL